MFVDRHRWEGKQKQSPESAKDSVDVDTPALELRTSQDYRRTCECAAQLSESYNDLSTEYHQLMTNKCLIMEQLTDIMGHAPDPPPIIPFPVVREQQILYSTNPLARKVQVLTESRDFVREFTERILPRLKVIQSGCAYHIRTIEALLRIRKSSKGGEMNLDETTESTDTDTGISPEEVQHLRTDTLSSLTSILFCAQRNESGSKEVIEFVNSYILKIESEDEEAKRAIMRILNMKEEARRRKRKWRWCAWCCAI